MSGKVRSNKDQKKTASKATPRSVVQKSTFQTGKSVQQNPEPSPDVAINARPADRCFQENPKSSSPNVAVNAKPANRYDTKTAPIIAYVHSVSPPKRNRRNTFDYATVSLPPMKLSRKRFYTHRTNDPSSRKVRSAVHQ